MDDGTLTLVRSTGSLDSRKRHICCTSVIPVDVMVLPRMVKAFELIRARTGKEDVLMKGLMKLPQVNETHLLAGTWDLMATLAFEEEPVDPRERMLDLVTGKIRKMPLVRDTNTIVPAMSRMREAHLAHPERRAYAFVFIDAKLGKSQAVMNEIMKYNEVVESHLLLGKSDVLAVLEFEKGVVPPVSERVARIVTEKIATINDITDTETLCPIRSIVKD
jgi:DNA-binding Lrp family transcriptional regulator